jgi:hypothetical protein
MSLAARARPALVPALLTALLLAAVPLFVRNIVSAGAFSSDDLFVFGTCRGWHEEGFGLAGWHLPPAAYYFPEMAGTYLASAVTADAVRAYTLYSLAFHAWLTLALAWLARQAGAGRRAALLAGLAGTLAVLAAGLAWPHLAKLLHRPSNHSGTVPMGLLLLALAVEVGRRPRWPATLALVLVGGAAGFSDQLTVVHYIAPAAGAACLLALARRFPLRGLLALLAADAAALALARLGTRALAWGGAVLLHLDTTVTPGQRARSLWALARAVCEEPIFQAEAGCALLFFGAAAGYLLWRFLRKRVHAEPVPGPPVPAFLCLTTALSLAGMVAVTAVAGVTRDAPPARYFINFVYLPLLLAGWFAGLAAARRGTAGRWALGAVALSALLGVGLCLTRSDAEPLRMPYPAVAEAADRLARERGYRRGLGGYWMARWTTAASREGVVVAPSVRGIPWLHNYYPGGFLHPDPRDLGLPAYHYVVLDEEELATNDPEAVAREYGPPPEVIRGDGFQIWVYGELRAPYLTRFLEACAAARLRRCRPWTGPSSPQALAVPRAIYCPPQARGVTRVPCAEGLDVHFDPPVTGRLLDVAAHHADEYQLSFYRADRLLAEAPVQAAVWTGAAYGDAGLFPRLVRLPEVLAREPFDRVHVRPVAGTALALGHFLVFDADLDRPARQPTGPRSFEAEDLFGEPGPSAGVTTDPSARGGRARRAGADYTKHLVFGPYLSLPAGRYRVDFTLKAEDNTSPDPVATLDAFCLHFLEHKVSVRGTDFARPGVYQRFPLEFTCPCDLDRVEFRVHCQGKAAVWVDAIDLTELPAGEALGRRD